MPIIDMKDLSHIYHRGTPYEKKALENITLSVDQGEYLGIVGANGSGKSTLLQHFNGLLSPTAGRLTVYGLDMSVKEHRKEVWKKVGVVFQYPEQQLFEVSVLDDVSYGPRNLGLASREVRNRSMEALQKAGLEPEAVAGLAPLSLSSGLRRRVAIAGVLAMRPQVLVLDEPTAGLDPPGREAILQTLKKLQEEEHVTVVMVSHSVREIISLAGRIAVLADGRLAACGRTAEIVQQKNFRDLPGVRLPDYLELMHTLAARGKKVNTCISTLAEAEAEIAKLLEEKKQ